MNAGDAFVSRPVTAEDGAFLRELYYDVRGPEFAMLPMAARMQLLDVQFEAQRRGYNEQYPGSEQLLIVVGEARAGRLWQHWSTEGLRVIDLSLISGYRRQGIGTALLIRLQRDAAARALPVRLSVRHDNPAARLYARLGFVERSSDAMYLQLEWRPGGDATG